MTPPGTRTLAPTRAGFLDTKAAWDPRPDRAADEERLAAIGEAVHAALVDAFAIPPDDRFQVLGGSGAGRWT